MVRCIENLVNEIYNSSKIPFQLVIDESGIYSSEKFKVEESYINQKSKCRNIKYSINVSEQYNFAINLLMLCLENKLNDLIMEKENIISLLLENKYVDEEIIESIWPDINGNFKLMNIYIEEYSEEIFLSMREGYRNSGIEVILYNNNILIIGNIQDVLEHAQSVKETISSEYCKKCYISCCEVSSYLDLKKAYDKTVYKLQLAIRYNISESIFDENKLILEAIIDSISDEMKNKIFSSFNSKMLELDNEMIKTIEGYFKCGLNLSEAAKELYIHRNTLIYRLDKIQKVTSYDIREFNNAMLFKIVFLYMGQKK